MHAFFDCGRFRFPLTGSRAKPLVMGILNVTPDSFADGGRFNALEAAICHAEQLISDGVDIIDIGGESSRPGAEPLPLAQEMERVLPVVYALRDCGVAISVDTYKPEMMGEALLAGADMINDIHGFSLPGAIEAVAASTAGLCVMHMQKNPQIMQQAPDYVDPVAEVSQFLRERSLALQTAGVLPSRICVDPGFGFGKNLAHNLALLDAVGDIAKDLQLPVLAGMSRKSMLGQITGRPVEQRLAASISAHLLAVVRGAHIVRVHDVAETVDALKIWQALANHTQ